MSVKGVSAVIAGVFALAFAGGASAATFQWVNGMVTSITAQLPAYTVAIVANKPVRFCSPATGADFAVKADNLHYDMLSKALIHNKSVEVGVQNFGPDPASGTTKLCIDRVILKQ
jgi:hypothetical protein